jgi:hypothetical protein
LFIYRYNNFQEATNYDPDQAGDVNSDGNVSASDIVFLIGYLFKGGAAPDPLCKADVNLDKQVSVSDIVYLVSFLFKGGPWPMDNCPW